MAKRTPKKTTKKRPQKRSIDKKRAFLRAFVECASIVDAAAAVGIDRSNHYDWLKTDPHYPARYKEARLQAGDTLESDAVRWARIGVYEPIVYQGQFQFAQRAVIDEETGEPKRGSMGQILTESYGPPLGVYKRSEGLLARTLKAFLQDRYGDKTEVSGPNGAPIENHLTVEFVRPK